MDLDLILENGFNVGDSVFFENTPPPMQLLGVSRLLPSHHGRRHVHADAGWCMAGDWIKMRGGLFSSPKLIGMSRALCESREFLEWLTPGGGGAFKDQVVSDHALRCVTGALLCVTWSWSREFGKALPNGDCLLPHLALSDLDGLAGAPGIGAAMASVGWALDNEKSGGVILPNFFIEHNIPLTPAEKQKAYRERKKTLVTVTKTLPICGNETVTREEKRREEKNIGTASAVPEIASAISTPKPPKAKPHETIDAATVPLPVGFDTSTVRDALAEWLEHHRAIGKPYRSAKAVTRLVERFTSSGVHAFVDAVHHSIGNNYQGLFPSRNQNGTAGKHTERRADYGKF